MVPTTKKNNTSKVTYKEDLKAKDQSSVTKKNAAILCVHTQTHAQHPEVCTRVHCTEKSCPSFQNAPCLHSVVRIAGTEEKEKIEIDF